MNKGRACVLVSGGVDSAALLKEALRRYGAVHPVYVACGLRWEKAELHWLRRQLTALKSRRLKRLALLHVPARGLYGPHWSVTRKPVPGFRSHDRRVYLPGRNLLLLSTAAVFCALRKIPHILLGTLRANPFPDSRPAFFRALERSASEALRWRVRVRTPFARLAKADLLRRYPGAPLPLTFSCLAPRSTRPCGRCNKCAEREKALRRAGLRPGEKI